MRRPGDQQLVSDDGEEHRGVAVHDGQSAVDHLRDARLVAVMPSILSGRVAFNFLHLRLVTCRIATARAKE